MKFVTPKSDTIFASIIISLMLSVAAWVQITYDIIEHKDTAFTTESKYIIPDKIIKNFSFGFDNVLADYYWVKAIQDFSIWDGKDPFYLQEYKNITTLDPKFEYPYLLAILMFTSSTVNNTNSSKNMLLELEPLIQKGIEELPESWEIPFYMGTGFQLSKSPDKALYYLKLASDNKDAPSIIQQVYRTHLKNILSGKDASGKKASQELLNAIYETTSSNTTKKVLESSVKINDLTAIFEEANKNYFKKYGIYPESLYDLVEDGIISLETVKALNKTYKIIFNMQNGKATITQKTIS